MAITLIFALTGCLCLHWSDWYRHGLGWVILSALAGVLFAIAFVIVCVNI